jgi:hypothetical protein
LVAPGVNAPPALVLSVNEGFALYEYDNRDNMVASVVNGVTTRNAYNGNNLRVSKTVGGVDSLLCL